MGIPKFMTDILSYTENVALGSPSVSDRPSITKVVVDGPSLVHFIYDRLIQHQDSSFPAIVSQPTYRAINLGVTAFLQTLQGHQIEIQGIIFDGGLPTKKRKTRLSRLEQSLKKLETYRSRNSGPFSGRPIDSKGEQDTVSDISWGKLSRNVTREGALPTPPFMVASAIEHLAGGRSHEYGHGQILLSKDPIKEGTVLDAHFRHLVHVVPGEADPYCAILAKQTGACVLSNDSDLALFDLGPAGSLVLLDSIDKLPIVYHDLASTRQSYALIAQQLNPHHLARCLSGEKCPDGGFLMRMAFERLKDPTVSTALISKRARSSAITSPADSAFTTFRTEFIASPSPNITATQSPPSSSPPFSFLDPRIAELLHAWTQLPTTSNPSPTIYLPLLLEDASRRPSWSFADDIRMLAYSLYSHSTGRRTASVVEVQKRGARIGEKHVALLTTCESMTRAERFAEELEMVINHGQVWEWRLFAITSIALALQQERKPGLSVEQATDVLLNRSTAKLSWNTIHITVNMQAVLYSLRLLKQIIHCVQSSSPAPPILRLGELLKTLPGLSELMDRPQQTGWLDTGVIERAVADTWTTFIQDDRGDRSVSGPPAQVKKSTTMPRATRADGDTRKQRRAKTNPFELLDSS